MTTYLPIHEEVSANVWFARKLGLFSSDPKEALKQTLDYWESHQNELDEERNEYYKNLGVHNGTV
jgi:hypothetical protein